MYRADGPVELRPVGEVEFVQGLAAAAAELHQLLNRSIPYVSEQGICCCLTGN
jgi:hypothetical protein